MLQRLRERRGRILRAALVSMIPAVVAGVIGVPVGMLGMAIRPMRPYEQMVRDGITTGLNTAGVVFWCVFLVLLLIEMTKSHAVLEFERRVKYAEELFKRGRAPR
jgi:hypothetical protein